jgi:hypothetical protein
MRSIEFSSETLRAFLQRRTVATMADLKGALGTTVDMTVLRKLQPLGYLSSYSQRGKFYTLREVAEFDTRGLFQRNQARFSRVGSLLETAEHFVGHSSAGYFAMELTRELGVETKEALLTLWHRQRVAREEVDGRYLHCARDPNVRAAQLRHRRDGIGLPGAGAATRAVRIDDEAKAALLLFFATLNERQRRLYAGLESLRVGYGGDRRIAELTGLDVHTVARGRQELLAQDLELDRIRMAGAGRVPVEKKRRRSSRDCTPSSSPKRPGIR